MSRWQLRRWQLILRRLDYTERIAVTLYAVLRDDIFGEYDLETRKEVLNLLAECRRLMPDIDEQANQLENRIQAGEFNG